MLANEWIETWWDSWYPIPELPGDVKFIIYGFVFDPHEDPW